MPHATEGAHGAPRDPRSAARRLLLLGGLATIAVAAPLTPPVTAPVQAASCGTSWDSRTRAPDTIKVFRTRTGKVDTIGFRQYVAIVMASGEFPTWLSDAVLEVGATAVKQYAWYYALEGHHRPGYRSDDGVCYDVRDDTMDQLYRPEKSIPRRNQLDAIEATWGLTLRKKGRFFLTGYRAGTEDKCASDADGWRIYTRSAEHCATAKGWTRRQIQEAYYLPNIEFVWSDVSVAGGGKRERRDPRVSTPRLALVTGQQLDRRAARMTWRGSDTGGSGLARYQLQRRLGDGRWRNVELQGVLATTFRFRMPVSSDVRFRVRAFDGDGNASAWQRSAWFDGRVVQSQNHRVTLGGPWRTLVKPAASGGTSRYTIEKGSRATIRFRGRSMAIVAPTGPGRGRARIFVDGKRMAVIDLKGTEHVQRRLVWTQSWATSRRHVVRLQVLGTDGRPRIDVDAFVVVQ